MRTAITRLLLIVLAVVLAVFTVKHITGEKEAFVSLRNLEPESLEHAAFELKDKAQLAIDAGGSFESGEIDTVWAAYGWIVHRESGKTAWRMTGSRPRRGSFRAVSDTVSLPAGIYDAYFSSHGDPEVRIADRPAASLGDRIRSVLSREGRGWYGDADRWRLVVNLVDGQDSDIARLLDRESEGAMWTTSETIWSSGPLRDSERKEELLLVSHPSHVIVNATGEMRDGVVADSARLVSVTSGSNAWQFEDSNASWAGGSKRNRHARDTLRLDPGVYRVIVQSNEEHAYGDWRGHPPLEPHAWGMRIDGVNDSTRVQVLDPFSETLELPGIVSMDCIGSDSTATATFRVEKRMSALVVAVGEITGSGVYDYAFIDDTRESEPTRRVWEMTREKSEHAGGASKNRRIWEILTLEPGTYQLTYETDGSHDCSEYNARPPDVPGFWGARVYALDPTIGVSALQVDMVSEDDPQEERDVMFDMTGLGPRADLSNMLITTGDSVHIVAVGELTETNRSDYGWIENAAGQRVWEMTYDNTEPAGGHARNRRFEGRVALPAGQYVFRFVTDINHDVERFVNNPPDAPGAWGMLVTR